MQRLVLKDLPRYECLVAASKQFPELNPSACEAFMHLTRAGDDVWRVMSGHFTAHDITQGRFMVMMLLLEKNGTECPRPRTPADLAELASVSRATITGLLDTLERDGFIRREPDPDDRRQISVHLTLAGQSFMHGLLPAHFQLINSLMSNLNEDEHKTLVKLLLKIVDRTTLQLPAATP